MRNRRGKAIRGARVKVEQLRHDFRFGSNFFMFGHCGKPELEEQYRQRFEALLNYCTLGFYWASYERERGKPHYAYTDQVVAWTREHGITCKGHPLVWDHPAASRLAGCRMIRRKSSGSPLRACGTSSRAIRAALTSGTWSTKPTHLADKPNKTKMANWAAALGAVPYVAEHLKVARAANPQATLLVNDYRIGPAYYKILDSLRDNGKLLFDAVGIQSHMH